MPEGIRKRAPRAKPRRRGKRYFLAALPAVILCAGGLRAKDADHAREVGPVVDLGVMDGFYRYRPVLGEWMATDLAIRKMPEWMRKTDFPYQKRPYDKEVAFADGLTCVRLLGGLKARPGSKEHPEDLAFRDADGRIQYRWNLLKERLDPYIALGYADLTLVLDNVPWCFPKKPEQKEYGQIAPPSNFEEWGEFIAALCRELKRLYGGGIVSHFRFRMGTEMQDQRRFAGDFEDYLKCYDYAAAAVKAEIPKAGFGPFNRSNPVGPKGAGGDAETVSIVELARHALNGTNRATGGVGSPFDFFARSYYYFSSEPRSGVFKNFHPDERVPEVKKLWDEVGALDPRFAGLSREVQEFGPHLRTEEGLYGLDTGARGAAQTFHTLMALKEAGADRVWHWMLFEDFNQQKTHSLLMGQGWLYTVLDHLCGARLFIAPVESSSGGDNTRKAALAIHKDRAFLVVANWNVDRTRHEPDDLTVRFPATLLPGKGLSARMLVFDETTSVYDVLRSDLAEAGLLSEKHRAHRGAPATSLALPAYDSMAADPKQGRAFLEAGWSKYETLMRESLRLGAFKGQIEENDGAPAIRFRAPCPSVTVIELTFASPAEKAGK